MKAINACMPGRLTVLALSLAIVTPAFADEVIDELSKPTSVVRGGLGYVLGDNQRFGYYNDLADKGTSLVLDVDWVKRSDEDGRWMTFSARNLGLDTREAKFGHSIQGQWGYSLEYNAQRRNNPLRIDSGITGLGTNTLTLGAGGETGLTIKREKFTLGGEKFFGGEWDVFLRFQQEEKTGNRMWGQHNSFAAGGSVNFMVEPLDSTITQVDLGANYTTQKFQLQAGYYGSLYDNHFNSLTVTNGQAGLNPIALPPDNFAHQLYVNGGYNFTAATRGTFKVAYTTARQDDTFMALPGGASNSQFAGTPNNLGGRMDTVLVTGSLNSRLTSKLNVRGDLRYEDLDNKTPRYQYMTTVAGRPFDSNNPTHSRTTTNGTLEASYSLPAQFKLVGGVDYEKRDRNHPPLISVSYREETEETGYRVALSRMLAETLNGKVSYLKAKRTGSDYIQTLNGNGTLYAGGGLVAPRHWGDRKRDQWKLNLDWSPTEAFSAQMAYSQSDDTYGSRTYGLDDGSAQNLMLDLAYLVNDEWSLTGFATWSDTKSRQTSLRSGVVWQGDLSTNNQSWGVGFKGKPSQKWQFGGDLVYARDISKYGTAAIVGALPGNAPLDDILYKTTSVKLHADYALQKNSGIRVDLVHDRVRTNDWTWNSAFTYADGTVVSQKPTDKVNFIGIMGYYKWK